MPLSKQALLVENNTNFPNNNAGYITPALLREFNADMIDAMQLTQSMSEYAVLSGSNTFIGNQTITGNLNVNGVISASVLYVQTETASVIYSSGSNQFGDELTDIQTLSGSVKVQGSLTVNGVPVVTGSVSVDTGSLVTTASFNAYTQSTNLRLNSLETNSASVNVSISNLNTTTASLSNSITNINSFTQSQAALNGTFATTGSNTFTGNQIIDRASKLYTNGVYWTDMTAGFNNLEIINQGGGNLDFASLNGGRMRVVNTPLQLTGSILSSNSDISTSANVYGANLTASAIPAGTISSSAQITSLGFVSSSVTASSLITASFDNNTRNLTFTKGNNTTFAVNIPDVSGSTINTGSFVTTSSFNSYTSSTDSRLTNIETTTASLNSSVTQLNANTASVNTSITNINSATASLFTSVSLALVTASFSGNTLTFTKGDASTFGVVIPDVSGSTINTGSFATTGSNTFNGNQTITGANALQVGGTSNQVFINSSSITLQNPLQTGINFDAPANFFQTTGNFNLQNTISGVGSGSISIQASNGANLNISASQINSTSEVNITGNQNINGNQSVVGAIQASDANYGPQFVSPTVFQGVGSASVAYDQFINGGNYDAIHIQSNLNAGTDFQDLPSDTFVLNTWLNIPTNTGNNPTPQFKRGLGITGSLDVSSTLTASLQQGYVWVGDSNNRTTLVATSSFGGGGTINTGSFATTGSNTFRGTQTIETGNLVMGNGFTVNSPSGAITNLSAGNTIQFITEGAAGPGGTNDIKFINRVSGSKIIFENTQGGQGNGIEFTAGYASFNIGARSGSTGKVEFGSNTTSIEALFTPISASAFKAGLGGINSGGTLTASLQQGYVWAGGAGDISKLVATSSFGGGGSDLTSLNAFTASQYVSNSFFATTGSNTFTGQQTINQGAISNLQLIGTTQNNLTFTAPSTFVAATGNFSFNNNGISGGSGSLVFTATSNSIQLASDSGLNLLRTSGAGPASTGAAILVNHSGSLVLSNSTANPTTLGHISSSAANSNTNLIFKTSTNTADTIVSGSGNIFTNPNNPTAGFKRYIGGSNNIINTAATPLISGSMQFSPTFSQNYIVGGVTMRGPVSSSAWTIAGNYIAGTISLGSNATNNAEKLVSGLGMNANVIAGTINIIANQSFLTGSTTTFNSNFVLGTVGLQLSSSAVSMANNIINDAGFTFTNQFFSSSAGLGSVSVNRNNIAGQAHQIIVSGSQPAGTITATSFSDNFMGGGSNIIYGNIANSRVSGTTAYHQAIRNIVFGNALIITGSSVISDLSSAGSAFFGRYNSTDGNKDMTAETIFAVGTGTAEGSRKTGFLIDSGSNTFVEGTLNVSGSTTLSGSLYIQSGSTLPSATGSAILTWNPTTGQVSQSPIATLISSSFSLGAFNSTITQSGSANVSQSMTFNNTDISNGVSIVSNSQITLANNGTYNIQFSAQVLAGTGADTIWIWLKKNGTNVDNTATKLVLANNEANVAAWNFVVPAVATDYFELVWQNLNGHATLLTETASGNYPAIPSVILTVTQVE